MTPRQFEEFVSDYFQKQGYKTEVTAYSGDYGVDVFAIKGKEKIAVQAKMYGSSTRKINRQMIMELHGAKDYFDCTKAAVVTDGNLLSDAIEVANKLKIEIVYLNEFQNSSTKADNSELNFERIWEKYIMPLQGKVLERGNGDTNQIVKVDWAEVQRITSNGKNGKIKIEIFKSVVNKLLNNEFVTRDEINQNYVGKASSGIVLILSQVPFFEVTKNPIGLKFKGF